MKEENAVMPEKMDGIHITHLLKIRNKTAKRQLMQMMLTNTRCDARYSVGDGQHGGELRGVNLEMRRNRSLQLHVLLPKRRELLALLCFGIGSRGR